MSEPSNSAASASGSATLDAPRANVTTRHVTAGFGWIALCNYSNRILGLFSTLILAKLLTPSDFGLVAIAAMMIEVIQLLKDMGLSEAVIYSKREDRVAVDTAHTILVAYNVALFLLAAAAAPLVAKSYGNPTLLPVTLLMASNLVLTSLRAVPLTLVRKNLEYRKLVLPDVVPVTVSALVSIGMALTGFGVWSLVAKSLLQSALALILIQVLIPYRPKFAFDAAAARELFKYGKFVIGTSIMLVALYNLDKFYVSKIAGVATLGVYQLAMTFAELPIRQFSFLIGAVMFPVFSKMERTGPALRSVFLKTLKYTASVTLPSAIGLAVFGPALVWHLYGPRWEGLGLSLRVLALYAALRSLSSIIYDLFKATGNPRLMQYASTFKLACVALLAPPAIYAFGVPGMGMVLVFSYTAALCWEMTKLVSILETSYAAVLRVLIKPLALSLTIIPGVYALLMATGRPTLWHVGVAIALAGSAYALVLYWLDEETAGDFKAFRAPSRPRPAG